ncbi:thiamine pyrophosphate-binding protein [Amycolatopsis sp. TRM77291]
MEHVKGGWRAVAAVLRAAGVRSVFGLPGDDLDALGAFAGTPVAFRLCRDQRNGVFMATGYALQSGGVGVAIVGKGPAVTNTLTGLLEARCSAAPVLLLAGGTSAERLGSGAFQEVDQLAVIRPLVKWAARVEHPARLVPLLRRALLAAEAGVPGPVYLELPDHLLNAEIPLPTAESTVEKPSSVAFGTDSPALRAIRAARRPLVLVGGGLRHRNSGGVVERFAAAYGAALACTASGRGTIDETAPSFVGLAGLYTPEAAARIWAETDCVIALGSRLEETATFGWPDRIGRDIPVVQVNVDAAEFSTDFGGPRVVADGGAVLEAWLEQAPAEPSGWGSGVREVHEELRAAHRAKLELMAAEDELHIAEVLDVLDEVVPADRILVQENGLQDMWSYFFPVHSCAGAAGSIVPSEQTSLGFGAAASVGVKEAAPDRPVVAFVGDGAFTVFSADVGTAAERGGILYVVLRNGGYGWLQSQLDQRSEAVPGVTFVDDFVPSVAPGPAGLSQVTVTGKENLRSGAAEAWKLCESGRTVVLNVQVRFVDAMFGGDKAGGDFPDLH